MSGLKALIRQKIPRAYNQLRSLKFLFQTKLFKDFTAVHSFGGLKLKVHITDTVARDWYDHDWQPLAEIELLKKYRLQPGAIVFDIGAHQNIVAMMLAHEAGQGGKVIAVEGCRHNYEIGAKNLASNGFSNVVSVHSAVADREGELLFSEGLNGSVSLNASEFKSSIVTAVTIDGLARDFGWPDLVFLDVEGHEIAALQGATKTRDTNATWFIEVHGDETLAKYGSQNSDVLRFFPTDSEFYFRVDETLPFERLSEPSSLPKSRFFLIVIPPATSG